MTTSLKKTHIENMYKTKVEKHVNGVTLINDPNSEPCVLKHNNKLYGRICDLQQLFGCLEHVTPLLQFTDNCVLMEFIKFGNSNIFSKLQNLDALGLYTCCTNLTDDKDIDKFISLANMESFEKMILFSILCGYGDYGARNIMLRWKNDQIHFVLAFFCNHKSTQNSLERSNA